jgi:cyanophycinase
MSEMRQGALVLIGGAAHPTGAALGAFLRLANAQEGGKIVTLTSASYDPASSAREWMIAFEAAGATHVEIPIIDRRDRAQDLRVARMIEDADGIFFGGGDQVQLVTTLGGTRLERAVREAYARGAIVSGTSAGAAALTETVLAGGEPDEYGQMKALHLGPGFGLLGFRTLVDTHFVQRRRLQRLFLAVAQNPDLLGLGIDEDTALVVRGAVGEVVGSGSVTFVDGLGLRFDNADEVMQGRPLTVSHVRVGMAGAGYALNFRERELEVVLSSRRDSSGGTDAAGPEESAPSADPGGTTPIEDLNGSSRRPPSPE